jgi:hypothetical protein
MIFGVLLLAAQPQAAQRDEQQLILVEPVRSPWARPSGVSHYRQRRVGDWRITTWRDSGAGDRVVRLQRGGGAMRRAFICAAAMAMSSCNDSGCGGSNKVAPNPQHANCLLPKPRMGE